MKCGGFYIIQRREMHCRAILSFSYTFQYYTVHCVLVEADINFGKNAFGEML